MRHRLFVYLVWTTRDCAPLIDAARAIFLARLLPAVARQERAAVLAIGIVATHVHLVLRLDPATGMSRLVQRLKGGSAALASREGHGPRQQRLCWARGYNLESVSPRAVPDAVVYLARQAERHPSEVIAGWSGAQADADVASATGAEPRL